MKRFFQILFYGALTVGIFAYYYSDNDRDEIEVEHVHEHEFDVDYKSSEHHVESRSVMKQTGDFHSVDIHGNYQVFLTQGNTSEFKIESEGSHDSEVRSEISNGVLKIYSEKKSFRGDSKVKIYVEAPIYKKLGVHGAVSLKSEETLEVEDLEVVISGAAETKLDLDADEINIRISGAGEVKLSGEAEELEVSISGAGDIRAYDLVAEEIKVSISGAGNANVHATEELHVSVSGAGSVSYKGSPNVNKRVSGFGSVKQVN